MMIVGVAPKVTGRAGFVNARRAGDFDVSLWLEREWGSHPGGNDTAVKVMPHNFVSLPDATF
jgi:hypothetical protein